LLCLPASAYIVDNFDSNVKTGWSDTGTGSAVDSGGVFTITATTTANSFMFSTKTGGTYTNTLAAGHTLEFRVFVNGNPTPANPDTNTLVVLGFVPTGGNPSSSGYSMAIGRKDFQILKNGAPVISVDPTTVNTNWNIGSCIMSLRLTESGGKVTVNARVHKQTPAGFAGQYIQELFEQTLTSDTPGFSLTGNVALGVKNRTAATAPSAVFDNLSFFDMENTSIDQFGGTQADLTNNWVLLSAYNFAAGSGDTINEGPPGDVVMTSTYLGPVGGYVGCFYQTRSFLIDTNGGRVEFNVDLVADDGTAATFPVLGFLPGGAAGAASIREYFVAPSGSGTIYDGKQYGTFISGNAASRPQVGYGNGPVLPGFTAGRMTIIMTGEGGNCRTEYRLEDTTQDVNSSNRLVWCQVFVDTPAKDTGASENSGNQLPYMNTNGNMVILCFNAGAPNVTATFDNAAASFTVQPVAPPVVKNASPSAGVTGDAKFLDSTSTVVQFDASDNAQIFLSDMSVTLNGVKYTNGSPGVTISPLTAFSTNRHFSLSGVFSPNLNYTGNILVNGPTGLGAGVALAFDTFLTNIFTVELEEYNFTTNYDGNGAPIGPAGLYSDNYINCSLSGSCYSDYANGATYPRPETICEGCLDPYAYNGKQGVEGIDFHSNHGPHTGQDTDHSFRYDDPVRTERSGEVRRGFYVSAGAPGDGGFNEQELEGIHDGDWQNYTHNYPAGYYQVYLRQSNFKVPVSLVTLELVTSDATVMGQTTSPLGSFIGADVGSGFNKNIPLSDGSGNPIILHLAGGVQTLRVTEHITGNDSDSNGRLTQNYMVFAPVASATLRPILASASPPPNAVIANKSFPTSASILNRDTSVDTSSIVLKMNGATVPATITPTATGADITWSLNSVPIARSITNVLTYSDGSVTLSNVWSYSYLFIVGSNSLPVGTLTNRGFDVRMVQIDVPTVTGNGELVGELMLSVPPQIVPQDGEPPARQWQTNVDTLDWNDNNGTPKPVPGLDAGLSGYPWPAASGNYDNIATESYGYLQLSAGAHRFFIRSDDSLLVGTGTNLYDGALQIGFNDGTYYVPVDFMVETTGLYPMRSVWHENGGYAEFHLSSVNPDTAAERIVNDGGGDQNDPYLVKAYYPSIVSLYSSSTANGAYAVDSTAVCDGNAQTVTVPISGGAKFYKLNWLGPVRVTKVAKSGSSIVISYKLYFQPGF
jgi:hypothetical protein